MLTSFIVICIYLVLYALSLQSFQKALFFYVVSIMLRPLIATPFFLFIGWHDVFLFILIFHLFQKGFLKRQKNLQPKIIRALVFLAVIILLIPFINSIRRTILFEDFFGVSLTFRSAALQALRLVMHLLIILTMLKKALSYSNIRKTVYTAMVTSATIVLFSMFFAPYLASVGINVRETFEAGEPLADSIQRLAGLIRFGNVNSVATFLNLVLCMVLIDFWDNKKAGAFKTFSLIVLLAAGIVFTASRMGLYMLQFTTVYFISISIFSSSVSLSKKVAGSLTLFAGAAMLFFLLGSYDRLGYVFVRIHDVGGLQDELGLEGGRSLIWFVYFEFIFKETNSWLFGSTEILFPFTYGRYQAPHNFFLTHVYLNGIVLLLFLFFAFYRLFASFIASRQTIFFIPLTTIAFISMMSQDSGVFIYYYIFCLGIIIHKNITSSHFGQNHRESQSLLI